MPLALVVDDHVSQLRLTEITLAKLGLHVLTAEHPRDALQILKDHTPDLVVLDVHLPDMSGIDIAGRLRGVTRLRNTPILFITSHKTRTVVEQAAWEGVQTVFQKPLANREFATAVRNAVPTLPEVVNDDEFDDTLRADVASTKQREVREKTQPAS